MKALIDTCVVMDFLQHREPFADDAKAIFRAAACEQFTGCITAKSATDIYYLTHRCTHNDKEARNKLNSLLSIISMVDKQPPHTRDFSRELGGSSCNLLPHMV